MSQLADIKTAQDNLEEAFTKRMAELEAQLQMGGPAKDTVAKVAEEFRTFRELMFSMLGLLRKQITECFQAVDAVETRHRRKALVFLGVPEVDKEDCKASVLKVINRMELPNVTMSSINVCHRIGAPSKSHHRPILVWFTGVDLKSAVWNTKTKLKGTSTSVKEFLTRPRQIVFGKARHHFGMRACWTSDGVIVVKTVDGRRHKITTMEELSVLQSKYSKDASSSSSVASSGVSAGVTTNIIAKPRK